MEFPDIEFEIGADAKRKIDSLYNHIAGAVYNLSMHVSSLGSQISEDHKDKISEVFPGSLCPLPPAPDSPAPSFSRAHKLHERNMRVYTGVHVCMHTLM